MASKTVKNELDNFLHTRVSDEVRFALNAWLHERPDLLNWLDVPESRRHAILEAEGADAV